MADGTIVIGTEVDNKQAAKDLANLEKKIQKLQDQIYVKKKQQSPITQQSISMAASLDAEKAKLAKMTDGEDFFTTAQISEQAEYVKQLQKEWDKVQDKVEQYDRSIEKSEIELKLSKERAGEITEHMLNSSASTDVMGAAISRADAFMERFSKRVKGLAKRVFVFTVISAALRVVKGWIGKVIQKNDEAVAAFARLKGALLTLAQPIVEILVPALVVLANVLTRVITVAAQLVASLFGKSIKQTSAAAEAMNAEAEAIESAGDAAKEAVKNFSGLDEINTWDSGSSDSSSGVSSGGSSGSSTPNFDLESISEERLNNIWGLVKAIGTALLAWRLSKSLGLELKETLGLAAAIYGAITFVENAFDAINNGVTFDNINGMLGGLMLTVGGLYVALGPVAAGIAAVVGGLSMLAIGFYDASENGWNLQNLLLSIAGIFATGIGISVLTGSFIPLLIAGIAALLLAITVATGHGEELINGLKETLTGFIDFFAGIFTGDTERTAKGIEEIFSGLKNAISAVIDGLKDCILKGLDWLDKKTNGKLKPIIDTAKGFVTGFFDWIKSTLDRILYTVKQVFTGVVQFVTGTFSGNWKKALKGVGNIFIGVVNAIFTAIHSVLSGVCSIVNAFLGAADKAGKFFGGNGISFRVSMPSVDRIPMLAAGAVIPPNREFMAVLGDQKNGNNIETPEKLLRQIMREELGDKKSGNTYHVNATANGRVLFQLMISEAKQERVRTGRNPFELV